MLEKSVSDQIQDILNKLSRAHKRATGCHLTAQEIHILGVTQIGAWWGQPDPRDEKHADVQPLTRCAASRDGECCHAQCPQLRDGEPRATGRHCPLDNDHEDDNG